MPAFISPCIRIGLVLLVTLSTATLSLAQAPAGNFTLRWFGQSFFQLETPAGKKIVFDPHLIMEFGRPVVDADIILCSHQHSDHTQLEAVENHRAARVFQGLKEPLRGRTLDWNRIDEKVGAIRIRTVGTYHDPDNGTRRGKNSVFIVEAEGMTFCHLGDLGHELTPEQIKQIGPVDVLMIPIGGVYTLNGEMAQKVMKAIQPRRFTVPMHYAVPGYDPLLGPEQFLDGLNNVKKMPGTNELVIPAGPSNDPMQVVLLGWQKLGANPK